MGKGRCGKTMMKYLEISNKKVARTVEIVEGIVLLNLDINGNVVGIEVLGEFSLKDLKKYFKKLN